MLMCNISLSSWNEMKLIFEVGEAKRLMGMNMENHLLVTSEPIEFEQ